MKKTIHTSLVALATLAASMGAQAQLNFTLQESDTGVTLTGSGSFNSGNLLLGSSGAMGSFLLPGSGVAIAQVGPRIPSAGSTVTFLNADDAITGGPDSFGSFKPSPTATSSSGDTFGFAAGVADVYLPPGYVSGTELNGQTFWSGETLASLGATPGTYVWNTSFNGVDSTITLTITAVPEPHEYAAMAALGLLGFAGFRRWRQRA